MKQAAACLVSLVLHMLVYFVLARGNESIILNYQSFTYNKHHGGTKIGLTYSGGCKLNLSLFMKEGILQGSPFEVKELTHSYVIIPKMDDTSAESLYFKIIAHNNDSSVCSDKNSEQTYYHVESYGIATWHYYPLSTVKIPIPRATSCKHMTFVWPKYLNSSDHQCQCVLANSFENCARTCESDYNIELKGDSIFFYNASESAQDFLTHFVCDEQPNVFPSYYLVDIQSSHKILVGEEDTHEETYHYYYIISLSGLLLLSFIIIITLNLGLWYKQVYSNRKGYEKIIENKNK